MNAAQHAEEAYRRGHLFLYRTVVVLTWVSVGGFLFSLAAMAVGYR